VTLAGAGALLVSPDGARLVAPFPVEAVDTTAAGDAFSGYLGAALAEGATLDEAVVRAAAAGALAVTVRGASPSLPARERVDAFLAERPAPEIVDGSRA
jgi:ribokinase